MDNSNNHSNHKQILSNLKPLVSNLKLLNSFNEYVDYLISQQHKLIEQADNPIVMNRSQGAIASLRKLKTLRDEVNANNG
jgi:hypothetical protein